MGPNLVFLLHVRSADPLNSSRTNRKVDQILVSDRQTDGQTDGQTDRQTNGRIKRIEDVERGAELSFFVACPLRGPP